MAFPPALTKSARMLSTPTSDFPILSALNAASNSSLRIGRGSSASVCGQSCSVGSPSFK